MKSSKLLTTNTFHQNQFLTFYLIFNFRLTYFSYFQKITTDSYSHIVKKTGGTKVFHPVLRGP